MQLNIGNHSNKPIKQKLMYADLWIRSRYVLENRKISCNILMRRPVRGVGWANQTMNICIYQWYFDKSHAFENRFLSAHCFMYIHFITWIWFICFHTAQTEAKHNDTLSQRNIRQYHYTEDIFIKCHLSDPRSGSNTNLATIKGLMLEPHHSIAHQTV